MGSDPAITLIETEQVACTGQQDVAMHTSCHTSLNSAIVVPIKVRLVNVLLVAELLFTGLPGMVI
jgi:hypothetical protein